MRTPKRHVAADGTVSYRVRHVTGGRNTSTTFRGPDAEREATEFAEFLWVSRGARLEDAKKAVAPRPKRARRVAATPKTQTTAQVSASPLLVAVRCRGNLGRCLKRVDERHRPRIERAFHRARSCGRLTIWSADSLANQLLGVHPSEVWGEEWPV